MKTITRSTAVRWLLALACLLGVTSMAAPRLSATDEAGVGGLWKDQYGRLFCGGTCNKQINQVCCRFETIQEQTPTAGL